MKSSQIGPGTHTTRNIMDTANDPFTVRRKHWKRYAFVGLSLLLLIGVPLGWWNYHYPYGWSHCCDKALYLLLMQYADAHNGEFPNGEASPEASLSLLQREFTDSDLSNLLRGKSVPQSVTEQIFARNELLGPESCGWNYVEGLKRDDNPRLALFWDKAGLDHNGGRLSGGGHIVYFVWGEHEHVKESEWPQFVEEQERLLSERKQAKKNEAK